MMGGMGFFHFPPSRKYLCAKITVLNNNKNDQKCLNFFFLSLGKKKIMFSCQQYKVSLVKWSEQYTEILGFYSRFCPLTDQPCILRQVPLFPSCSVSITWGIAL